MPGAGERSGVGGILFVSSIDKHATDVEGQGSDQQQGDQPACEQDEDLTALAVVVSC